MKMFALHEFTPKGKIHDGFLDLINEMCPWENLYWPRRERA